MPFVVVSTDSSGKRTFANVPAPKQTPVKTYIYRPSTINAQPANGSTRTITRDANTGALISDTGYVNSSGTGAGSGVSTQDVIQDQRSGSSPLQTAPDWNKVSNLQIKQAGYNTLSEYKSAYKLGSAISPSKLPTQTTSQKLTSQLTGTRNLLGTSTTSTSNFKFNIPTANNLIPSLIPNQDVPTITKLGLYNTEKTVTKNYLNSPEIQSTLERLNKLKFKAEKEARLKTESRITDLNNTDALAQRQIYYGQEKQASDTKQVTALNAEIVQFNSDYTAFQEDYARRDLDKSTPELELTEKNYTDFTAKNNAFKSKQKEINKKQEDVKNLFKERTNLEEAVNQVENPIIRGYFNEDIKLSAGATAGIKEVQRVNTEKEYAGTPAQKAFAGQPKNLLTAILATPQIYSEQYKQTGTKKTTSPYFNSAFVNPAYKDAFTTETPTYTNIFDDQEITDLNAPTTYDEELKFKKQIGLRAGLATARDPYNLQDLTEDLITFRNDVLIGTVAGGVIGSVVPTLGTIAGATTGGLTGAIGGATNVITSNVIERQTGSEFLGESLGTVTGIGAEIISVGAVSKAVAKTISANPRLIGSPQSIAYDLGKDKLRLIRYSKFKTGTGFLTRKFDVIDDVIIKRSDLIKNLTKEQTEAIFKQATNAPKYLTDDVIKGRINIGKGTETTDITKYMGEFTKESSKKIPLNKLLEKIDITEFSGVQRISARTGKDLLTKIKTKFKPTIYDNTIEGVSGFQRVQKAEKAILVKKGTKTFQFEGIGFSYSEADELAEGIVKAQKGTKTTKIKDLKLIGKSKYANLPQKEQVFKLNPKQTTTDLQEDFIFIKAKQKGTRLFTNKTDDYSRFIAQTRQKGFSKTITFQGDETIISPTTKFKSDILTFSGTKGKGQIIKTSTKGLPDDYMLRIANPADDLPKGTKFTSSTITKAGDKVDDALGLGVTKIKGTKNNILQIPEYTSVDKGKGLLQIDLERAIEAYSKSATPATLKKVQLLSTQMANLNAYPAIIGARLAKQIKLTEGLNKISKDFSKKGSMIVNDELNKINLDFAKKRGGVIPQSEPDVVLVDDKVIDNVLKRLNKTKPTIKPSTKNNKLDPFNLTKKKGKIVKPVFEDTTKLTSVKTKGGTLLATKTEIKPITDSLTKATTKSMTAYKPATAKTAYAKAKTATKTIAGTTQDNYSRARTAYARAKAKAVTKPLFARPQLRLRTIQNIAKLQVAQKVGLKTVALEKTKAKTMAKTKTMAKLKTETLTRTDTKTATATATLTDTLTRTDTKTKTDTATLTATTLITAVPTMITPFIKVPAIVIPRLRLPSFKNPQQVQRNKTKLYIAQVRVKNNSKWKTVSQKPQPQNKAYNEGLEVADNTVGQSVRTIYKKTVKKYMRDDPSIKDYKFRNKKYKSKIPSNPVKIELRQFAIDTYGEKQGLSVAKYLAQKRARNNLNKKFINNKGVRLI